MAPRATTTLLLATALAAPFGAGCSGFGVSKPATSGTTPLVSSSSAPKPSFSSKIAAFFTRQSGVKPVNSGPKTIDPTSDSALSISKKTSTGPDLNVAMAHVYERNNNYPEAVTQYKKALQIDEKYLAALEGLARLEDHENHLDAATDWYIKAIEAAPKEGRLYNELGLCLHRHAMLPEASKAFRKAIELQPDKPLYRNNLAWVLLEMNDRQKALEQLIAASGPAVGHYNMGYLLWRKKDYSAAEAEFNAAVAIDPTFEPAQKWIAKLHGGDPATQLAAAPGEASGMSASTAPASQPAPASQLMAVSQTASQAETALAQAAPPPQVATLPSANGAALVSSRRTSVAAPGSQLASLSPAASNEPVAQIGIPEAVGADAPATGDSMAPAPGVYQDAAPPGTAALASDETAPSVATDVQNSQAPAASTPGDAATPSAPASSATPPVAASPAVSAAPATPAVAAGGATNPPTDATAASGAGSGSSSPAAASPPAAAPAAPAASTSASTATTPAATTAAAASDSVWTPFTGPSAQVQGDPIGAGVSRSANAQTPAGPAPPNNVDGSNGPALPSARRSWFQRQY